MAEFGFTGADIASISNAREGLVQGFMQLGKQIQVDIERIAVTRQLKGFSQELSNLDPTDDAFPQRLIQTMSRYPLAANTPMARNGIELLGAKYRATQYAKNQVGSTVGQFIETVDAQGNPVRALVNRRSSDVMGEFPMPEKASRTITRRVIDEATGQVVERNFDEQGNVVGTLGQAPLPSRADPETSARIRAQETNIKGMMGDRLLLQKQLQEAPAKEKPALYKALQDLEGVIKSEQGKLGGLIETIRPPSALPGSGGVTQVDQNQLMAPPGVNQGPASNFVPMPNPQGMTLNQEGGAVMPDNLPVLPGVKPTPTQAGTPRLYQKDPSGRLLFSKTRPKEAVQQAFSDQVITEEQFQGYMGKLQ